MRALRPEEKTRLGSGRPLEKRGRHHRPRNSRKKLWKVTHGLNHDLLSTVTTENLSFPKLPASTPALSLQWGEGQTER